MGAEGGEVGGGVFDLTGGAEVDVDDGEEGGGGSGGVGDGSVGCRGGGGWGGGRSLAGW